MPQTNKGPVAILDDDREMIIAIYNSPQEAAEAISEAVGTEVDSRLIVNACNRRGACRGYQLRYA
jgi:hypothetical protein